MGFNIHRLPKIEIRFIENLMFWVDIVRELRRIRPGFVHAQSLGNEVSALSKPTAEGALM
jgi:hypothetical protein